MTGARADMRVGGVIWITGLAGSGKTRLATRVIDLLRSRSAAAVHLDGDVLRRAMDDHRYDRDSRERLAFCYSRLAWSFASQGHACVVSTVSLFHSVHAFNREQGGCYLEVLLDIQQGIRSPKETNHFDGPRVGMEIPAEFPCAPHLVFKNDMRPETLGEISLRIADAYEAVHAPLHR